MTQPILLVSLLIVLYFSGSQAENGLSQYWEEHIGHPLPPHWLATKASPLSPHQVAVFMKLIEKNELSSHLSSFCKQANIACSTNTLVNNTTEDTTMPQLPQWNIAVKYELEHPRKHPKNPIHKDTPLSISDEEGLPFFRESMVKEGGFMSIPDLKDPMSYISFLPRPLASKIPFSFAKIDELKKLFNVVDESNMDEYIQDTLETCEKSTCLTSGENLIDFVVKKLGHHVHVWNTESIEGSCENVTIGAVKLIYGNLSEPPALCHSQPFPFQVYFCHVLQKVKVYAVDLHAKKKVNHAIMACHYDTSTWNSNNLAFKLLGFGPGQIEICHWINKNGMVWTRS